MKKPGRFLLRPWVGAVATALVATAAHAVDKIPDHIRAAVADPARAESDVKRDVNRKPAEVLTFAGVKPGDKVGELLPGRGYYTALFCKAVGDKGHVTTVSFKLTGPPPPPPPGMLPPGAPAGGPPGAPPGAPPSDIPSMAPPTPPCGNVTQESQSAAEFKLPSGLDMVWTSENYHDLFGKMLGVPDLDAFNKVIFNALKPGGVYMVEDHAAAANSGIEATSTLHRIDPAFVKQQVVKAGFVFEGESKVLNNPDDPHTGPPFQLQGKSDKFLFKFRKPK
jgi:predicted methyltransferase